MLKTLIVPQLMLTCRELPPVADLSPPFPWTNRLLSGRLKSFLGAATSGELSMRVAMAADSAEMARAKMLTILEKNMIEGWRRLLVLLLR